MSSTSSKDRSHTVAAWESKEYLHFRRPSALVDENAFRLADPQASAVPSFAEARRLLPEPYWDGHEEAIDCWWRAWQLAWSNIRQPTPENGFIRSYIDTAFNDNLFLWDSVFILLFARYGARTFDFQQTLDNFYARQHDDGFICRELRPFPGGEMFYPHDPASTGPNLLAWCEWDYYLNTGDMARIRRVFPVLLAYHRWLRTYRTWPDGSYFHSGYGSGMDNQPIDATGDEVRITYRHLSRIDATAQALLSANCLCSMATLLQRERDVQTERAEAAHLRRLINTHAWNPDDGYYYHWHMQDGPSAIKSVGAYWTLLAQAVPTERLPRFVDWLEDEGAFKRPHRIPSIAFDCAAYCPDGGYWRGGVWPPTNYMALRGLSQAGYDALAFDIARNHHDAVLQVFAETDTVWEFYAPEQITQGFRRNGAPGVADFVGWGGLAPIAILLEYRFGLRPGASRQRLIWDIREQDAFGVRRYPFGCDGVLDLHCAARTSPQDPPDIRVQSNCDLELTVRWAGGERIVEVFSAG